MEIILSFQADVRLELSDPAKILKHAKRRNVRSSVTVSTHCPHTVVSVCRDIQEHFAELLSLVKMIHAEMEAPARISKRMVS